MLKRTIRAALTVCLAVAGGLLIASPASADYNYVPPTGSYNGYKVFLSVACHDGNDGVPGGACIPNTGCKGYDENVGSLMTSLHAANAATAGAGSLVDRGFRVRVGTGTAGQNITSSNQFGANLHVPIHSNATNPYTCTSTTKSTKGTLVMYTSTAGQACAAKFRDSVGAGSPGTNDFILKRTNLGELNQTNATACYLEAEYHTWDTGVNFLRGVSGWSWRVAMSVDQALGYP